MDSTHDIVLFVVLLVALIVILIWYRRQDSKRVKQKILEAMSPELRAEIEEERRVNTEKKRKFEEALSKASGPGGEGGGRV